MPVVRPGSAVSQLQLKTLLGEWKPGASILHARTYARAEEDACRARPEPGGVGAGPYAESDGEDPPWS